jgi:hypothetical protein
MQQLITDLLNNNVNEVTLDSTGISEYTYDAQGSSWATKELELELLNTFSEQILENKLNWDLIGKTLRDNKNYFEDTISLTFNHIPKENNLQFTNPEIKFVLDNINCVDCYTQKFKLNSRKSVIKIYESFNEPDSPSAKNIRRFQSTFNFKHTVISRLGIGRHFGDKNLENFRDLYFTSSDPDNMALQFGSLMPDMTTFNNNSDCHLYGLCFDNESFKTIKLKRYFYPRDPNLNNVELI